MCVHLGHLSIPNTSPERESATHGWLGAPQSCGEETY